MERRVPAEYWNAAIAVDPGDHVVTFASPGQPVRTFTAHVDMGNPSTIVRIDEAPSIGGGDGAAAPAVAVAAVPATAGDARLP